MYRWNNKPSWRAHVSAGATALLVAMGPGRARAEEQARDGTQALERGNEAVDLYEKGKWNEALKRFQEAESLYHSPVFILYIARCLRNSGRLLEARNTFQTALGEALDASAPAPWKKAHADALEELTALEGTIPSAVISVERQSKTARIDIDGRPAEIGEAVELDPGEHRVTVTDNGVTLTQSFALAAGSARVPVIVRGQKEQRQDEGPRAERATGSNTAGLVLTAAGGVTILAGGVFGVFALRQKEAAQDRLPDACDGTTCPSSRRSEIESEIDKARALGTAADVLFVSGIAAATVGVVLLVTSPHREPPVSAGGFHRGLLLRVRF